MNKYTMDGGHGGTVIYSIDHEGHEDAGWPAQWCKVSDVEAMQAEHTKQLDVANRVYLALEEDGYYGSYTLGEGLWQEFKAAFALIHKDK